MPFTNDLIRAFISAASAAKDMERVKRYNDRTYSPLSFTDFHHSVHQKFGIPPDQTTYNTLLQAYASMGYMQEMKLVSEKMMSEGLTLDTYAHNTFLTVLAQLGNTAKLTEWVKGTQCLVDLKGSDERVTSETRYGYIQHRHQDLRETKRYAFRGRMASYHAPRIGDT